MRLRWRTWRRWLLVCTATVSVLLMVVILVIQANQYRNRRRAERLLSDIRSLELHRSTLADVHTTLRKWGNVAEVHRHDSDFEFEITLNDALLVHLFSLTTRIFNRGVGQDGDMASRTYLKFGGRPCMVTARVLVHDGMVTEKSFLVLIEGPLRVGDPRFYGREWTLGSAGYQARALEYPTNAARSAAGLLLHPGYVITQADTRPNSDTLPGSDIVAHSLTVGFTRAATSEDVARYLTFDLHCLTRWKPCTVEELMPEAYKQYSEDERLSKVSLGPLDCTGDITATIFSQASHVAVATVASDSWSESNGERFRFLEVRTEKSLRGIGGWERNHSIRFWIPESSEGPRVPNLPKQKPWSRIIVAAERSGRAPWGLFVLPCGVLENNSGNRALVERQLTN